MEARTHDYSVKQAEALFGALQKGDQFLEKNDARERKNPWVDWDAALSRIRTAAKKAKYEITEDRKHDNYADGLFEFFSGPEGELPQIPDHATVKDALTVLIEKNTAALLEEDLTEEAIEQAYQLERAHIQVYICQLASQHRLKSKEELEGLGYKIDKFPGDTPEEKLREAQKREWGRGRGENFTYASHRKVSGLLEELRKAWVERKLKLLDVQTKAKETAVKRPSRSIILNENYRLGKAEEKTLRYVLMQCTRFFAQLHDIDAQYASEIEPRDLTLDDFQMALAAAPKALQPVAFEVLRALLREELVGTFLRNNLRELTPENLHSDYSTTCYGILSPELREALSGIGTLEENGFIPLKWQCGTPNRYITGRQENAPVQRRPFYCDMDLQPAAVSNFVWEKALLYKVRLKGENINYVGNAKLIACTGDLRQYAFCGTKLLHFMGNAQGSHFAEGTVKYPQGEWNACEFDRTEIMAGSGFRLTNSYIHAGMVHCHEGVAFSNVIFHRSEIVLADIAPQGNVLFEGCDFTDINISAEDLKVLAARSKNCRFPGEDHWGEIDTIIADGKGVLRSPKAPKAWQTLISMSLKGGLEADMLDPRRKDLKGVPPSPYLSGSKAIDFDPREWAKPLGPDEPIETFTTRQEIYRRLIEFVQSHPEEAQIRLSEWMGLLHDMGSPAITDHLGLSESLLHYSSEMLERIAPKELWYGTKPRQTHLSYIKRRHDGAAGVERYVETSDLRLKYTASDHLEELTPYSKLKQLREILIEMFKRLYRFGQYMQALLDQGYAFPEINPEMEEAVRFTGLVHPDVNKALKGKAVRNDIVLDPDQCVILNISSADNNDGKSTLQATLVLALLQAQCGLPVPANRTEFNPARGFDYIMILPNTRADAGQGEGVMKERAERFKELKARLTAIANTENPPRVLILMDEISMGATNHKAAVKLDTRMVLEIAMASRTPGIDPMIIVIVQDADQIVPEWKRVLGAERVTLIAKLPENPPHTFVPTEQVAVSKPDAVLEEMDLGGLLKDDEWA